MMCVGAYKIYRQGNMIRIACIDDEKTFRDTLNSFLNRYSAEKDCQYQVEFFDSGMNFLLKKREFYNLLFVDIEMPEMDGMRFANKVREYDKKCVIVFTTNLQNYAIKGYEVQAFDYILKPLSYPIFCKKMDRIMAAVSRNSYESIILTTEAEKKKVLISDIIYVETDGHKVVYHLRGQDIDQWCSMKETYAALKDYGFELCNSCYLVNLKCVEKISGDAVVLGGGIELHMSRPRRKKFIDAFTSYIG